MVEKNLVNSKELLAFKHADQLTCIKGFPISLVISCH